MFIKSTGSVGSHPKLHTYEEGYLLPVLTAQELFFSSRHRGLLRQIRDFVPEFNQEDFDRSYGYLISRFAEFVQLIPNKSNGIIGSLLNYSLSRAVVAMQKYHQQKPHASALLKFAIFSAGLLKNVGRVLSNQRIVMTDKTEEVYRDWNPLSGSLLGQTPFYKMYPIGASYLKIEKEIASLLARQLITEEVFLWLSQDPILFADWLAALMGEEGAGAKEISLTIALIKRDDIIAILNALDVIPIEPQEPVDQATEAFYRWLKQGIEKGEISINKEDSAVHVVAEGVLIEKKLFKQFADLSKLPVNFAVVFTQFGNLMGIPKKGGNDYLHAAYFSPSEGGSSFTTFSSGLGQKAKGGVHEGMVVDLKDVFMNNTVLQQSGLKKASSMNAEYQKKIIVLESPLKNVQNRQNG